MKSQWYCGVDGQQYGPFTWEQLRGMAAEGRLVADSFVRREADQQWFPASKIPGLLSVPKPAPVKAAPPAAVAVAPLPAKPAEAPASLEGTVVSNGDLTVKLKRAKPLTPVAPTAAGVAPVGPVAVGQAVPVGVPVGVPAGVPVGQPFSHAPVSVAAPPAFAPRPATATDDDIPSSKRKSSNAWLLVGILGGTCAVVAIGGGVLIAMSMTQKPDEVATEPAATAEELLAAAQQAEKASATLVEGNPTGEANPAAATPATGGVDAAKPGPANPSAAAGILASQTKWIDLLTHKAIKLGSVSLQVSSVWLASDEQGTRVNPSVPVAPAPAATEATPAAEGDAPAAPVSATPEPAATETPAAPAVAKYVFVEVKISNLSPVPKKYVSWNAADATAAVMADQANQILTPVPPAATPGVNRLLTVQLAPNQTVTDLIVFTAPTQPVESLKLALVKTALAETTKGHWAFEIPLESLFAKSTTTPNVPAVAVDPVLANQPPSAGTADLPATIIAPEKPAEPGPALPVTTPAPAPAAPEPPKKNKPPTIDELNKQFEELDKAKKEAEKKPGEPAANPQGAK